MAYRSSRNSPQIDDHNNVPHKGGGASMVDDRAPDTSVLPASGFVTVAWVKRRYSLPNSTLFAMKAAHRFPQTVRIGLRSVRFRVEDLRAYEASLGTDTLVIKAATK